MVTSQFITNYGTLGNNICDKNCCGICPDFQIDPTKPSTVTTQFITDGTHTGKLDEVKQFYIQTGETIEHPEYSALGNNICDNNGCGIGSSSSTSQMERTLSIQNIQFLETTSATRMVAELAQISRSVPPSQLR